MGGVLQLDFYYILLLLMQLRSLCSAGQMNVLFLAADDMRPQLGCFDGPDFPSPVHPKMHTPNLDALAAKSLLLKQAYVQQAVCSPSRTSLLTGRRPDTTHVYDLKHYFRKVGGNYTTIPEYFKQNGYFSAGMGKIFHPGAAASGKDDPISWSVPYFHGSTPFESNEHSWLAVADDKLVDKPLVDKQTTDRAIEMLKNVSKDAKSGNRPFFIALGFHKPHLPFVFPKSMLQYYPENSVHLPDNPSAPQNMPRVAWSNYGEMRSYKDIAKLNASGAINTTLPKEVVLKLRRAYYSAITWTDSLVGRVVTELDNLGLADSTIISFWGDHGWQLGEHGEWSKHTNFELATHAPMMVHIPGMTDKGISTNQVTEFVDLFPTLVDAAGLPKMPLCPEDSTKTELCREGTSLLPLITQPEVPIKMAAFSQYPRDMDNTRIMGYTIRTSQYRYTEWPKFDYASYKPVWSEIFGAELYDHQKDPEENINRADDIMYQTIRQKLSIQLHQGWRKSLQ